MENFCESLREDVKNVIHFEKEELKSHQDAKVYYICVKSIFEKLSKKINYWKVRPLPLYR